MMFFFRIPKVTKTLGYGKGRAWESSAFIQKNKLLLMHPPAGKSILNVIKNFVETPNSLRM
jgi:hypothetical protein